MPFDQYQRYRLLAEAVAILEGDRPPLSIVEVGGFPPRLPLFLPGRAITVVDRVEAEAPGYVRADGAALPFPDRSFGIAASLDALEHVPPSRRADFISELCRVASSFVIVAAPFASPAVRAADRTIFEFVRSHGGYEHPYLKEHLEIEPPDRDDTARQMVEAGLDVRIVPSGRLDRWLLMMTAYYTLDADPELRPALPFVMEAYNRAFFPLDRAEPAYRHFLIGAYEPLGPRADALAALISTEPGADLDPGVVAAAREFARALARRAQDREAAGLAAELAAREIELRALREENQALHEFRRQVKSLPLYSFYDRFLKPRKK